MTNESLIDMTAFKRAIADNAQYDTGFEKDRQRLETFVSYYESCKASRSEILDNKEFQISLCQALYPAGIKHPQQVEWHSLIQAVRDLKSPKREIGDRND
jgi:hypothetical protein